MNWQDIWKLFLLLFVGSPSGILEKDVPQSSASSSSGLSAPKATAGPSEDTTTSAGSAGGDGSKGPSSDVDPPCTSDEEEGGPSKVVAPKLKATLQRRAARAKRALAYQ